MLTPYLGRSFGNMLLYAGAGPSLAHTHSTMDGLIGFADFTGTPTDQSGAPTDFSASQWVLGGAATAGFSYYFTPALMLDLSYAYAWTKAQTSNYFGTYTNASGAT